jgi:hypothetical protein
MPTRDEIHRHVDAATGDDPREALIAVRKLINDDLPLLERRAVHIARAELWSWVRISRLLLRSRQAVRERFRPIDALPMPEFESDDLMAKLNADAEAYFRRVREKAAARAAESGAGDRAD